MFVYNNHIWLHFEEKYMQRWEESQQHQSNEGSSQNSSITSIDDNELYHVVVGVEIKGMCMGLVHWAKGLLLLHLLTLVLAKL